MKNALSSLGLLALILINSTCLWAAATPYRSFGWQERDSPKASQHAVASKTVAFGSVSKTDEAYTIALDAHDLAGAYKKVGQKGAFKGTVSMLFEPRDGNLVILDFDPQYRTALTAVLMKAEFAKFPDLKPLEGKEILVSGSFVDYQGKAQIVLTDPAQIRIVK